MNIDIETLQKAVLKIQESKRKIDQLRKESIEAHNILTAAEHDLKTLLRKIDNRVILQLGDDLCLVEVNKAGELHISQPATFMIAPWSP